MLLICDMLQKQPENAGRHSLAFLQPSLITFTLWFTLDNTANKIRQQPVTLFVEPLHPTQFPTYRLWLNMGKYYSFASSNIFWRKCNCFSSSSGSVTFLDRSHAGWMLVHYKAQDCTVAAFLFLSPSKNRKPN